MKCPEDYCRDGEIVVVDDLTAKCWLCGGKGRLPFWRVALYRLSNVLFSVADRLMSYSRVKS